MRVASGVKERDEIKRARERRVRDARAGCDIRGLERSGGGTTLPNCSNADINGKGGSMHEDQFSAGTLMTYNKDRPMSPYILFCGSGKWGMRVEVCGHPSHSFVAVGPQCVVGDHQDH